MWNASASPVNLQLYCNTFCAQCLFLVQTGAETFFNLPQPLFQPVPWSQLAQQEAPQQEPLQETALLLPDLPQVQPGPPQLAALPPAPPEPAVPPQPVPLQPAPPQPAALPQPAPPQPAAQPVAEVGLPKKVRMAYQTSIKKRVINFLERYPTYAEGAKALNSLCNIPAGTVKAWWKGREAIKALQEGSRQKCRQVAGGRGLDKAFETIIMNFCREERAQDRVVLPSTIFQYILQHQPEFWNNWHNRCGFTDKALLQKVRRVAYRNGYKLRVVSKHKLKRVDLGQMRDEFINENQDLFEETDKDHLINVDETSILYEYVPKKTLAEKGSGNNSAAGLIDCRSRITAVIAVAASGRKLPILFILPGQVDGNIARNELQRYDDGHYYITQPKAWMDTNVWEYYVEEVLSREITGPSQIVLDNLKVHVNQQSIDLIANHCGSLVCPLPANTTSVCQPLDVGVMGPLKASIKKKWLHSDKGRTAAEKRENIINITIQTYNELTEATIRSAWKKSLDIE